ncbi:MAG: pyridoxal-phosphate dependent enzyme, partial [Lentisphaeria bacterium]|nr:pyridoxal-phosphate dependent enzyme [Lentisphaeria bacterium]
MENIKNSILETVGSTPLVRINQLNSGRAEVLVKVESRNPGGSVKDRVGIAMVEDAEKHGLI